MDIPSYDGAAAAAAVLMSPSRRSSPILFVEGTCEVQLLSHHLPDYVDQIISCGGHAGVEEAIATIKKWEVANSTRLKILGLIDNDYGVRDSRPRIITSENRDVEVDMYMTTAGEKLLNEKASCKKCPNPRTTISEAMHQLYIVGLTRYYNSQNGCSWNINNINLEKCINPDGTFNSDKFLVLLGQENGISIDTMRLLRDSLRSSRGIQTQLIIRGHDVSTILGKWLRNRIGNRQKAETSWKVIEENLRLATTYSELSKYNWARRIKKHLIN